MEVSSTTLSIVLLILGSGILLLALVVLRVIPQLRAGNAAPPPPPSSHHINPHSEAVLLVQSGGRVAYMNPVARDLFSVWEDEPNLESLARRTRPSEAFLMLCSGEGQARFSLSGRFVEGTSYYTPGSIGSGLEYASSVLVSLRRPQIVLDGDSPLSALGQHDSDDPGAAHLSVGASNQALNVFTEISQAMTASLDLNDTLYTVLESCERLLPSDYLEITLLDSEETYLAPYRLVGLSGVDRRLEKGLERYPSTSGYSGYMFTQRKPLLVKDVNAFRDVRPNLDRQRFPFRSFLGVPLVIAGEIIGTLELASLSKENYSEGDLQVLELLAGQGAVALKNALLFKQELERSTELAGLANLTQTVSAIRDPQDLYNRLIESISPLLEVDILGFLVYDPNRQTLEGQMPFKGIHPDILQYCQTTIQPDTPGERVWLGGDVIIAQNAAEDERFQALELQGIAIAAAMRHTVLVPLTSGGRMLGYVLAANKQDGLPFDADNLRLLSIVAGQAAPIIENADLVQQSRRRAQRAETLRRVASLTSSAATLDEILKFSVLDLARLLQADMAAILLLDEARGELRVHRDSTFGIAPELAAGLARLAIDDPQFPFTVTGSKQQYITGDMQGSGLTISAYKPIVEALQIRAMIDVPLIVSERGIGELMIGSLRSNFFQSGDIQTLATASGQLAAAIERANLYSQTDQSLRQRVEQLTALTRVSRELNTTLKLDDLLERVYDEVLRATHADCGTIMLFDLDKMYAIRAGWMAGDGRLPILFSFGDTPGNELLPLEQQVLNDGEAVLIEAFASPDDAPGSDSDGTAAADAPLLDPNIHPAHPGVRSALIAPIAYQGQVAGLIHLHSKTAGHFSATSREITEALAVQAAIALGNAHRFNEQRSRTEDLNRRVEVLAKIFEVSQVLQTDLPLEQALEAIAYAIQGATPFDTVLISIYNVQRQQLERVAAAGVPLPVLAELRAHPTPWESMRSLLKAEYRLGRTYFIPAEADALPSDIRTYEAPLNRLGSTNGENQWNQQDVLVAPLFSASGEPLGLISVDGPRNNQRPDQATIETLEIFSGQAALVIESQIKVRELRSSLNKAVSDLSLAQETADAAQRHLPVLLHKDLERTLAIQQINQRARRINAGLDITELISHQPGRSEVLDTLSREILARMDMDVVLVAEPTSGGLSLTLALGNIPAEVNPKSLLGQRNPLRQTLQSGDVLLVSDLAEDADWQSTPLLRAMDARSFFCMPIIDTLPGARNGKNAARPGAALLGISQSYNAGFTAADKQLFDLMVRQVAIALQNLHLLADTYSRLNEVNLLLDFSRQLGSLDPASIIKVLLDSTMTAVPNAQMALVALWDGREGYLTPQAVSGYQKPEEVMAMTYKPGEGLAGQVFESKQALIIDEVEFTRHYNFSQQNLLHYRNATGGRLPVSSLAVPIMAGTQGRGSVSDSQITQARSNPLGVLVLDNIENNAAFTQNDLAVIASLAQQTALTLENARLYQASRQRSTQLQALTSVSTTITTSLRSQELTTTLLDQLQNIIPYDTGTLWLRQRSEDVYSGTTRVDRMVIRAASGFADSEQRIGLAVDVPDSVLLNEMAQTSRPIWVSDVRQDARFTALTMMDFLDENAPQSAPMFEHLSWLGVPLIASGMVMGVIALEKVEANYYTTEDIQIVATFAGQAAVGLVNAELYEESVRRTQELDQRSQTLAILNRLSFELSGSLDVARILDYAVQEFMLLMNCSAASAITIESQDGVLGSTGKTGPLGSGVRVVLQAEYPYSVGTSPYLPGSTLPDAPIFDRLRESQGIFNTEDIQQEPDLASLRHFLDYHDTHSLLMAPMIGVGTPGLDGSETRLLGLLLAHGDEHTRFGPNEIELARTISNQVAIALQNAHLLAETLSLTEDLEHRVQERTSELGRERQRAETLLRIISELSASLDLDQVLNRTLHVLSEYVDAAQITILIARPGEKKLNRLASIGYTPGPNGDGGQTPLNIDEGLAGWIISQRQTVLLSDVLEDERWIKLPYGADWKPSMEHRSALGVPLMSGAEALGCLLLFHPETSHFSMDQLDLVQAAANQVAVAVNNAELYRLIRDQAEDLGTMLRSQQVETSRSKAILEAVADGVLVTDANRTITLFNESAEKVLGLERSKVLGKSMEQFSGMFGRATRRWLETINAWSQDASVYQAGSAYAEQISLEDGRVLSVRLAPVVLRNDFLGTVSIFQDVTHQVEVDRLKSEFVATVSHELRTPMTSIKGYVEILLMGAAGPLSEQQQHFLQVVKTNTERLAVLVNDLLDISQIEAGRVTLSLQPVNLEEMTDQALAELQRRYMGDSKNITTHKQVQPNLPRALVDPDRIRRIFDNLLDNAYQYNLPDGHIHVTLSSSDNMVQVDIQDSGVGIPPEDQERVFERFFRGESTLNLGVAGTGLGLAIVSNLIEMHGGRIWLTSPGTPGAGSTFSFTLPMYQPEQD